MTTERPAGLLREALHHIEGEGCDGAAFYGDPMPNWDFCLDPNHRELPLVGDLSLDRCHPCLAHAALAATGDSEGPRREYEDHDSGGPEAGG